MSASVIRGRVEDVLPTLAAESFGLIHADPPYYKVLEESWDKEWPNADAFLDWLGQVADEWRRILKPNGSLYCWASSEMSARIDVQVIRPRFDVLNSITWAKPQAGQNQSMSKKMRKEDLRSYLSFSEVIIFAEQAGADSVALGESGYGAKVQRLRDGTFEPLRLYLDDARASAGVSCRSVDEFLGCNGMARHYFRDQWALPTAEVYARLQTLFNGHLRREYEDLRAQYDGLRREYDGIRTQCEDLRRPFTVTASVPHSDVWTYAPAPRVPGRHPAEKPLDMMTDIVNASSRPSDRVLDCFAGSGSMSAACVDRGRDVVAVEMDGDLCDDIERRNARHLAVKTGAPHRVEMKPITGPLFPTEAP